MARIIYSALVTKISGSIAGTTFQKNAYGHTVKSKATMVRPAAPLQNARKIYFAAATKGWNTLSSAQKDAYNVYAATRPQYAHNNPTAQLSGFAIFCKWHMLEMLRTGTISINNTISGSYNTLDLITAATIQENGAFIDFNVTFDTGDSSIWCLFFISRPFRPGENFIGSKVRYLFFKPNADFNVDIRTDYENLWGNAPAPGDRLALTVVQIEKTQPFILNRTQFIIEVIAGA